MQSFYDYKKFAILYVDDEEKSLKYFVRAFEDQFRIFTATNAGDGYKILEENKDNIGMLITDQRMPGEKGVELLEKARQLSPRIVRILATAYSDIDAAVGAVNSGAIYKYVHKPWDIPQLEVTLRRGLEFFIVQRERDQLLREKMSVLQNIMITDRVVSLGILAAGLSHHVRNALVAVRTFLDLAPSKLQEERIDLEELRNPNYWSEFYEHVQTQVKRITELLNDLGAASDKQPLLFSDPVHLREVVSQAMATAKGRLDEKKIVVENKIPDSLPLLTVDQIKFHRLFDLLMRDEITNLPEGGRISFNARPIPGPSGKPAEVELQIEDDGPGLPEEALRSVFNPFFLRKDDPQEYGINLMACYFIVFHHGGRIEVKNREGGGTVFTLTFLTTPQIVRPEQDDRDFISKVLTNEMLWEKLLSGS